jgi:hypothetical protein
MRRTILIAAAILLPATGCEQTSQVAEPREAALTLTLNDLPPLDHHQGTYRLWGRIYEFGRAPAGGDAVLHSEMVPLGDFHVDPVTGAPLDSAGRPARFQIPEEWDPQLVASVMVSVEPAHHGSGPLHEHPGPVIMAGSLTGDRFTGTASLSPAHPEALGADLRRARGMYTVMAPTSPSDSTSGVWFVDYTTAPPSPLQDLPLLPPGWVYEGWAVDLSVQPAARFSTGRFVRPDSADWDGPGPGRGPLPGINFPGQDFITGTPATPDLTDARWIFEITLEPAEEDHAEAFPLVLFRSVPRPAPGGADAGAGPISRPLYNWAAGFPTASLRLIKP